ncbi:MAG: Fic family protein [Rhizobiaceae bacterium]|nr:Fic family protein [Rhizobiaceae bacterium]
MSTDRSSEADEPLLVTDPREIAKIEAENTLRQFDAAMAELRKWIANPRYRLKPSIVLKLNRVALERLSKYAGVFRPGDIKISGSGHVPQSAERVPELIEEFCDYVNENWDRRSAIHLSSYALWRLNWIHPFVDGNGRTARAVSYLVLCAKLGYRLPGIKTIPEQIASNKVPYYRALEVADKAASENRIDVEELEKLIDAHLAAQLVDVHHKAAGSLPINPTVTAPIAREPISEVDHQKLKIVRHIETHPVIYSFLGLLIITIVGALLAG